MYVNTHVSKHQSKYDLREINKLAAPCFNTNETFNNLQRFCTVECPPM